MKNMKKDKQKSKDKILNQIPIFLAKTFRIVDNPAYSDTIEWVPEGNGFVVKNVTDLTENIFPKHFKHTNYASFVRQLNLYGFHKVRSNEEGQIFTHDYFQRENADLLTMIKRKNATQAEPAQKPPQESEIMAVNQASQMVMPYDPARDQHYEQELSTLTEKHEGLQNLVTVLVEQNKEIIMQNKSFVNKLNKMDENYRKKLQTLIFLMVFGLKNGNENNIIVPHQLSNMIKAFTSKSRKKNKKNPSNVESTDSHALELFQNPKEGRFNNKGIEEILQMLKMESEGEEGSDLQENQTPIYSNLNNPHEQSVSGIIPQLTPQLSPNPSMHSLPYQEERLNDDWDFLGRLDQSQMDLEEGGASGSE